MSKMKYILCILALLLTVHLRSQDIQVRDLSLKMTDASASTNLRVDDNGDPCSLIKVASLNKKLTFTGGVVGSVENNTNEYWVYISSTSSELIIKCPGLTSQIVKFSEYGIDKLQPKATYSMTIVAQPKPQPQSNSKPVTATTQLSFEECKAAAKSGNPVALLNLGKCYLMGIGTTENPTEAVRYFEKAADAGNTEAIYRLGNSYYYGIGNPKDYSIAISYFEKASKQNYAAALYALGRCYELGHGVLSNLTEARALYKRAYENGYSKAKAAYDKLSR